MLPSSFFTLLALQKSSHSKESDFYQFVDTLMKAHIKHSSFSCREPTPIDFAEFGSIVFPLFEFGSISTLDLFGLDELIIFSFYLSNKINYKKALDIGGNIGLHSILMNKLGWDVQVYEPDPIHITQLKKNLELNHSTDVIVHQAAVYNSNRKLDFTRVKGNTTGSHLAGHKGIPYGPLDTFPVNCVDILTILKDIDFIKLDAEGAESAILRAIPENHLKDIDIMCELSTSKSREEVFSHFNKCNSINIFSQKINWKKISSIRDLPDSYHEGSIFITAKPAIPF